MKTKLVYEDCVALKDSGFPQQGGDVSQYYTFEAEPDLLVVSNRYDKRWEDPKRVKIPTLTEIIDECVPKVNGIGLGYNKFTDSWTARDGSTSLVFVGVTAEQAMARLWLALNKK